MDADTGNQSDGNVIYLPQTEGMKKGATGDSQFPQLEKAETGLAIYPKRAKRTSVGIPGDSGRHELPVEIDSRYHDFGMQIKRSTRLFDDTTPAAEAKLIELLRQKSPAEKLRMVNQLNAGLRTITISGLRTRFPGASEEELKRRYADVVLGPELADRVYGKLDSAVDRSVDECGSHRSNAPGH